MTDANDSASLFGAIAQPDAPVFETVVQMTLDTFERSGPNPEIMEAFGLSADTQTPA